VQPFLSHFSHVELHAIQIVSFLSLYVLLGQSVKQLPWYNNG